MAEKFQLEGNTPPPNAEYGQKMLEAGENAVNMSRFDENGNIPKPPSSNNTNGIPEKFINKETGEVDVEALAKSYRELEGKFSGKKEEPQTKQAEEEQKEVKQEDYNFDTARNLAKEKGIDFNKLSQEYIDNGNQFSEDTLKELEEKGITQDVINRYVEGEKALVAKMESEILQTVGGREKFNDVLLWAKDNLSDVEKNAYQKALDTRDKGVIELAVQGLNAKFIKANGVTPNLVKGKTPTVNTTGVQPFNNQQEYINAIKDPRYKSNDSSYRNEVYRRLEASKF